MKNVKSFPKIFYLKYNKRRELVKWQKGKIRGLVSSKSVWRPHTRERETINYLLNKVATR